MIERQAYLTPDLHPRLAAIDIGSNSLRLVVAEAQSGGRYRILDEERESTRLARSLATGDLDEESIAASLAALRRFKSICAGRGAETVRAIATCAVREASNGAEFVHRVRDELDLAVEVIDSDREAELAFESVRRRFDLSGKHVLLADIGGGSTELVLASGGVVQGVYATRLGAVRLAEKYGSEQLADDDQFRRMARFIDRELRKSTEKSTTPIHLLVGSGGTFTSLGGMIMAGRGMARLPAGGCRASRADVKHLVERLRKMSAKQRRETPGLNADRADIIVPGLQIIDSVMRRFRVNALHVHTYGVRDGLLLKMIDELQGQSRAASPSLEEQIDRFAETCGVDLNHARHVARLAGKIYSDLQKIFDLPPEDRRLLEAAARLQDVGYLISYDGHHKHSYHLILHSGLDGLRPEEREIVANVARYHRGANPKNRHFNFAGLAPVDRDRVRRMAAILRVAGGLDRSHNQTVTSVEVAGTRNRLELVVRGSELPEVDLWAAKRRSKLFERVFGKVIVQWADQPTAALNAEGR